MSTLKVYKKGICNSHAHSDKNSHGDKACSSKCGTKHLRGLWSLGLFTHSLSLYWLLVGGRNGDWSGEKQNKNKTAHGEVDACTLEIGLLVIGLATGKNPWWISSSLLFGLPRGAGVCRMTDCWRAWGAWRQRRKAKLHKEIEHSVNTNPSAWLGSYVGGHRDEEKIKLSKTICSVAKTYLKITV